MQADDVTTLYSFTGDPRDLPIERMSPLHRRVLEVWGECRGRHPAPRRADLEPAKFGRSIANVLLWETATDDYLCRLAGGEAEAALGGRMKGLKLRDIPCRAADMARAEFDAVRDRRLASYAERTLGCMGKPHQFYRCLLLPLCDADRRVHQLLGVLDTARLQPPQRRAA